MANNLTVKDAFGISQVVKTVETGGIHTPVHQAMGYDDVGGKMLVGTARERFFENFFDFDTTAEGNWQLVQTGPGMTITGPLGGAAAGSSPYLNIASGVAIGSTIIMSRSSFTMPVELRYQISASQRIANNRLIIGFVEVNDAGTVVTSTTYATAPEVLNAKNAVVHQHDGVTDTTAQLRVRVAGSALDTLANAFGSGFGTAATGSTPNFIPPTTYGLMLERDRINTRAWGQNVSTNTGGQFGYDKMLANPNKLYKMVIIVENNAVPASTTSWRLHLINIMDAVRFDVSPRHGGITDQSKAFPVVATILGGSVTVGTSSAGIAVIPAIPATPYFVNSLATTNGALILTGTSGVTAFWATNTGAAAAYVKLYNKATAPVVGTDIPEMIIPIPAAVGGVPGTVSLPTGFAPFRFALGLGVAITGGAADADVTAVAAGQVKLKLSRTV